MKKYGNELTKNLSYFEFEVLTALVMKSSLSWDIRLDVLYFQPKILLSKIQCCNIVRFINLLGHLLMERYNQIDHTLIDRGRYSNILDVRSFRAADCDTDHYLVVTKVRERLQ
jgi:hypothetical protein